MLFVASKQTSKALRRIKVQCPLLRFLNVPFCVFSGSAVGGVPKDSEVEPEPTLAWSARGGVLSLHELHPCDSFDTKIHSARRSRAIASTIISIFSFEQDQSTVSV